MKIYIDIETIPTNRQEVIDKAIAEVKEPKITKTGKYKTQNDIDDWRILERPELAENDIHKTGLSGTFGRIFCIAWAVDDGDVKCSWSKPREEGFDEMETLREFYKDLSPIINATGRPRNPTWVGHFVGGFDLKFIYQRSVVLGIKPSFNLPWDSPPWKDDIYDTNAKWCGRDKTSLGDLCLSFGLNGKLMKGSEVWDHVKKGDYKKVVDYNIDDVEKTREVYKRMNFIEDKSQF